MSLEFCGWKGKGEGGIVNGNQYRIHHRTGNVDGRTISKNSNNKWRDSQEIYQRATKHRSRKHRRDREQWLPTCFWNSIDDRRRMVHNGFIKLSFKTIRGDGIHRIYTRTYRKTFVIVIFMNRVTNYISDMDLLFHLHRVDMTFIEYWSSVKPSFLQFRQHFNIPTVEKIQLNLWWSLYRLFYGTFI